MGIRAHIQTKHEIEYGNHSYFNWCKPDIYDWLYENGVDVYCGEEGADSDDWEIEKSSLREIPEDAYADIRGASGEEITEEDLRRFVSELKRAPTGEYAYVSWF